MNNAQRKRLSNIGIVLGVFQLLVIVVLAIIYPEDAGFFLKLSLAGVGILLASLSFRLNKKV